jgi:peptidyl-prolyl cis-trans isomerase D
MLEFIRTHTRLALGFMLLLIIPSFVFFGIQGYSRFIGHTDATLAKVGGQSITREEWEDAHRRTLDQAQRRSPKSDRSQLDTPQLRRDTLDALVRERVLLSAANDLNLYPTVPRMARLFDSDPQFAGLRGADGKINRDLLAAQGMTPEMFDQRLRQGYAVQQVLAGITQTLPTPAAAASAAFDALLQRREVQLQRFEPAAYSGQINPGDADLQAYYKAHESEFKAPDQARIEYVVLDIDSLSKATAVTDADLRKAYEESASKYTVPEERRASHILIKVDADASAADRAKAKARAEALLAQLRKNPADFAALASKNSEDPGSASKGGDLGFFTRGSMVKPFEDAVYKLDVGQISDLVQTDFGYHIIMLTAKRGGEVKPFDQVRAELEVELRKSIADRRWADAADQFTNMVYEQSDSLQPVVDKLKLVKQTATVERTAPAGASGPLASAKLLQAVFSDDVLRNKRNTDAVEVAPNELVSARVVQFVPAHLIPLAEIKDQVRSRVVADRAAAEARKAGVARLAEVRAGAELPVAMTVSRNKPQGLNAQMLDAVLSADTSKLPTAFGIDLGDQGYVVMRVTKVLPREPLPGGDAQITQQYEQVWAAAEADAYVDALDKRYKVAIDPAADALTAASAPAR